MSRPLVIFQTEGMGSLRSRRAVARWCVHVGLIVTALVSLAFEPILTIHIVVGLIFSVLAVTHLAQRRQVSIKLLTRLGRFRTLHRPRRPTCDRRRAPGVGDRRNAGNGVLGLVARSSHAYPLARHHRHRVGRLPGGAHRAPARSPAFLSDSLRWRWDATRTHTERHRPGKRRRPAHDRLSVDWRRSPRAWRRIPVPGSPR